MGLSHFFIRMKHVKKKNAILIHEFSKISLTPPVQIINLTPNIIFRALKKKIINQS